MKDITPLLLGSLFVIMSLMSMLSAEPTHKATSWATISKQERVSNLGLRIAFKR